MRTRAERRKHEVRMKRKAEKIVRLEGWTDEEYIQHRANKIAKNRTACSCLMCGNPRKFWGHKTIQELRHENDLTIMPE